MARGQEELKAASAKVEEAPVLVGGVEEAPTKKTALKKGTLVLIKGLTRKPELNGRSGVVSEDYAGGGRYVIAFADRTYNLRYQNAEVHAMQKERDKLPQGDEVVFVSEEEQREGMRRAAW